MVTTIVFPAEGTWKTALFDDVKLLKAQLAVYQPTSQRWMGSHDFPQQSIQLT